MRPSTRPPSSSCASTPTPTPPPATATPPRSSAATTPPFSAPPDTSPPSSPGPSSFPHPFNPFRKPTMLPLPPPPDTSSPLMKTPSKSSHTPREAADKLLVTRSPMSAPPNQSRPVAERPCPRLGQLGASAPPASQRRTRRWSGAAGPRAPAPRGGSSLGAVAVRCAAVCLRRVLPELMVLTISSPLPPRRYDEGGGSGVVAGKRERSRTKATSGGVPRSFRGQPRRLPAFGQVRRPRKDRGATPDVADCGVATGDVPARPGCDDLFCSGAVARLPPRLQGATDEPTPRRR